MPRPWHISPMRNAGHRSSFRRTLPLISLPAFAPSWPVRSRPVTAPQRCWQRTSKNAPAARFVLYLPSVPACKLRRFGGPRSAPVARRTAVDPVSRNPRWCSGLGWARLCRSKCVTIRAGIIRAASASDRFRRSDARAGADRRTEDSRSEAGAAPTLDDEVVPGGGRSIREIGQTPE